PPGAGNPRWRRAGRYGRTVRARGGLRVISLLGIGKSAMFANNPRRLRRPWMIFIGTIALIHGGCTRPNLPLGMPSRPLLVSEYREFRDDNEHFRFLPPENWSMQLRSVADPENEKADRPLVKYKNLVTDTITSWMTVKVVKEPVDSPLEKCLVKR